jgi:hypothetical protein
MTKAEDFLELKHRTSHFGPTKTSSNYWGGEGVTVKGRANAQPIYVHIGEAKPL